MPKTPEYLRLAPEEAVQYFKAKVPMPTEQWDQFEAEQHDLAYTVAGLTRADLLSAMQWLISQALSEGNSFETFNAQFDRLVARRGWQPDPLPAGPADWRRRIIFETPIRRAYSAGRFQQMRSPEVIARRKYWQWKHGDSPSPRPNHLALHDKVFAADEPFWGVAFPSCAYGCKCRAYSLRERQVEAMGLRVEKPPDPYTIAEPGFRRSPGTTPQEERQEILQRGLDRLSPALRTQVEGDLQQRGLL